MSLCGKVRQHIAEQFIPLFAALESFYLEKYLMLQIKNKFYFLFTIILKKLYLLLL